VSEREREIEIERERRVCVWLKSCVLAILTGFVGLAYEKKERERESEIDNQLDCFTETGEYVQVRKRCVCLGMHMCLRERA